MLQILLDGSRKLTPAPRKPLPAGIKTVPHTKYRGAYIVGCSCGANPGGECKRPSGHTTKTPHKERLDKASKLAIEGVWCVFCGEHDQPGRFCSPIVFAKGYPDVPEELFMQDACVPCMQEKFPDGGSLYDTRPWLLGTQRKRADWKG